MIQLPSRKSIRYALADLIRNHSQFRDETDFAVFPYEIRDFGSDIRHAVVVTGASSERPQFTLRGVRTRFKFGIELWVQFRDPDTGWTEQNAEDRLDDTEADVANILAANMTNKPVWDRIAYEQTSVIDHVTTGGRSYLYEVVTITVEVL